MRVEVAKGAGFCAGVKSAVELTLDLANKFGHIYTIGELVHNELVTAYLEERGAKCIGVDELDRLQSGDVAVIRAHGIPKPMEDALRERGVMLYDATCPVVKRNQELVAKRAALGDDIIVVGDEKHDEVAALISYARADGVRVISPGQDLEIGEKPSSVVFQTTVLPEIFAKYEEFIKNFKKNRHKSVETFNTICYTTKAKQSEAARLAEVCDAVIVLGSRTSANTRRLFEVASSVNDNVFFVGSVQELLRKVNNKDFQSVSIVAGASTPPWLIREVSKLMSETQPTAPIATQPEVIKEATLQEETSSAKEPTMADIIDSNQKSGYITYRVGKRIKGSIISVGDSGIYVAIGGKKDGFIDKSEVVAEGNYNPADFKVGDEIQAEILAVDKDYVSLSKKKIDVILKEEAEAEKALNAGEFRLKMTEVVKGGLRGHLGPYTIFVPASQIKMSYVSNLEDYKDKELRLVIIDPKEKANDKDKAVASETAETAEVAEGAETVEEVKEVEVKEEKPKKRGKYLFASQRVILEREKQEREDAFWNNIHENDIVSGKVKRYAEYGAFVNVRGFDCLAHNSEVSWKKGVKASEVLEIGATYDFVVTKVNREAKRVSLSYKLLQPKPLSAYEEFKNEHPIGTVVSGKVERIKPYGAFVSIGDGVDGLVHVSQISHKYVKDANEVFTVGQEIQAKIVEYGEGNRITLSIKELIPEAEVTSAPADVEATDEEKAARRSSRTKRFEQKVSDGEARKGGKAKKEVSNEPKDWVSGNSAATLGSLFDNLGLSFPDENESDNNGSTEE